MTAPPNPKSTDFNNNINKLHLLSTFHKSKVISHEGKGQADYAVNVFPNVSPSNNQPEQAKVLITAVAFS